MYNISKAFSRINKYINNTPLEYSERLSKIYSCNVYLKREDLQKTRSFKIRGALNKIINLQNVKNGIVCASAGNHAQGVGFSANMLNLDCDIFIPTNTPLQKVNSISKYNINLHKFGINLNDTLEKAKEFSINNNKVFIHPYDDIDIIYGQGTVGLEIYNEINPDIIVSCVGGGGLISGLLLSSKNKNTEIIGAEPYGCANMYESIKNNEIIRFKDYDTFVDGASVESIGNLNFKICNHNLKQLIKVNNQKLSHEIVNLYQEDGIITEPAGALSVAALEQIQNIKDKNVVCIVSGGNNDISRYSEITEYALQYINTKFYLLIEFNQIPGQLKYFVSNILSSKDDITRFEYIKKNNRKFGTVLLGIETNDINQIKKKLNNNNIKFKQILENDDLYKILI
jgi:threonine dehydratase